MMNTDYINLQKRRFLISAIGEIKFDQAPHVISNKGPRYYRMGYVISIKGNSGIDNAFAPRAAYLQVDGQDLQMELLAPNIPFQMFSGLPLKSERSRNDNPILSSEALHALMIEYIEKTGMAEHHTIDDQGRPVVRFDQDESNYLWIALICKIYRYDLALLPCFAIMNLISCIYCDPFWNHVSAELLWRLSRPFSVLDDQENRSGLDHRKVTPAMINLFTQLEYTYRSIGGVGFNQLLESERQHTIGWGGEPIKFDAAKPAIYYAALMKNYQLIEQRLNDSPYMYFKRFELLNDLPIMGTIFKEFDSSTYRVNLPI